MKKCFFGLLVLVLAFVSTPLKAQTPAGATGVCNDGSYSNAASKRGACSGHKGVKTWYAASAATPSAGAPPTSVAASPPAVPSAPAPAPSPGSSASEAISPTVRQAPGGGNGQVWVNTPTKVYHCPSDRYYGKTKTGVYMSEADATAKGDRPAYGKTCAQ